MYLDVEVLRFYQQNIGNGAPLHLTLQKSGTDNLDSHLTQLALRSSGGGHRVCLGDAEALFPEFLIDKNTLTHTHT